MLIRGEAVRLVVGIACAVLVGVAVWDVVTPDPKTARPTAATRGGDGAPGGATSTATTRTGPGDVAPAPQGARPMPIERAIGQRLISGYHGAAPTGSILRSVRAGRIGGVILFGDNVPTIAAARRAIRALDGAAAAGHQPRPLIFVDQEGGDVKRFTTLPPRESPAGMGASPAPERHARSQGRVTGKALRSVGVDVDLAPVADVPAAPGSFLGTRAFSRSPGVVAHAACGFARGLRDAGVAATFKHFPGLGRAGGNTDFSTIRLTAPAAALRAGLAAYRRCGASTPLVMMASASYPALGMDEPAVLEPSAYRLLASTGFRGLTISDAFDTPAIATRSRPALRALRAGLDLLLYSQDEAGARNAYARLVGDAHAGRLPASEVRRDAQRIIAFKQRTATPPGG